MSLVRDSAVKPVSVVVALEPSTLTHGSSEPLGRCCAWKVQTTFSIWLWNAATTQVLACVTVTVPSRWLLSVPLL